MPDRARTSTLGTDSDTQRLPDSLPTSGTLFADLTDLDEGAVRAFLQDVAGFDALTVTDALRSRHPPKFEALAGGRYLLLLRGFWDHDPEDITPAGYQFSLFRAPGLIAVYANAPDPEMSAAIAAAHASSAPDDMALIYGLMRRKADRGLAYLHSIEPWLDEVESRLAGAADDVLLMDLIIASRALHELNRRLEYQVDAIRAWSTHEVASAPAAATMLTDVVEQVDRHASLVQLYLAMVDDLRDGYVALSSHRLNRVMQVLTVMTVVFMPLGLIAGIYGMNFETMPELGWPWGYFIALGVMAGVALSLVLAFKRKGWL